MPHPLDMKKITISNTLIRKDKDIGFIEGIENRSTIIIVLNSKRIILWYFCNKFIKKLHFF